MKKNIVKILAILGLFLIFPVVAGLTTLDGTFCLFGHCQDVIPFWGGFLKLLMREGLAIGITVFIFMCLHFIYK